MDVHLLRADQLAEFREIFCIFADPRTNRIPLRALLRIRADLGFVETEETLSTKVACLVSAEASTSGLLFHDFLSFVAGEPCPTGAAGIDYDAEEAYEMELGKVFKQLDLKGDGVLDSEEILAAAATAKKEEADAVDKLAKSMPKDFKISFEGEMMMEDVDLVLDDAVKRVKGNRGAVKEEEEEEEERVEEKFVDSWLEFERAEKRQTCQRTQPRRDFMVSSGGGDGRIAANSCLDFRRFQELMRE